MPDRLSGEAWARALHSFRRTAWRWETQGVYREPYEQPALRQFLAGEEPDLSFMDGWYADIRRGAATGRRYGRVRVLTDPLTDYLRFELSFTAANVAAGEDVRILPAARARELDLPMDDFWLFDADERDAWAALMHFGPDGFTHADVVTDGTTLDRFREIRDRAWEDAIAFEVFRLTR
ncbi:MAG: DUF6879 family protein [Actinophytocola sp.]|uniref:DUF6879 family protein n=1 Tax=Actinophytocola sp. TaxID=1872138 RepID=UPI003C70DF0D